MLKIKEIRIGEEAKFRHEFGLFNPFEILNSGNFAVPDPRIEMVNGRMSHPLQSQLGVTWAIFQ